MLVDEPDTEWIIRHCPPVPHNDLNRVQDILRGIVPFVPGVFLEDPYEVSSYVPHQMMSGEEFCLLVDRNIVTRWVGAARGQSISNAHRNAAAIMLFAQCADLLIEPTLAFYEITSTATPEEINSEIDAFYTAEEADPIAWADIALGKSHRLRLPPPECRRPRKVFDLSVPLYKWRRCYILALKIAALQLEGGPPEDLMCSLLDWMFKDFLIGGPAIQLASYYFAPGAPRKKLLKRIQSADREQALRGIRNAAWDMTLISEWLRHVKLTIENPGQKRLWILCTLDQLITRMAQDALSFNESEDELTHLERTFGRVWKPDAAMRLAKKLHDYQGDLDNPSRQLNKDPKGSRIDQLISAGEVTIRSWVAQRGSA